MVATNYDKKVEKLFQTHECLFFLNCFEALKSWLSLCWVSKLGVTKVEKTMILQLETVQNKSSLIEGLSVIDICSATQQ